MPPPPPCGPDLWYRPHPMAIETRVEEEENKFAKKFKVESVDAANMLYPSLEFGYGL